MNRLFTERWLRRIFWCLIIAVITLALLPSNASQPPFALADKVAHAIAFFIVTIIGFRAYPSQWWYVTLALIGLGASIEIAQGYTATYADIARSIGRPRSARPVGGAVGKNPLPIVVPCHRVIGSDRTLTGFTGGLDIKMHLLQLEGRQVF